MRIQLVKCTNKDIDILMSLYQSIIEQTKDMEIYGQWKKDLYPTEKDIQSYIDMDAMYMVYEQDILVGAIGITFSQGESYKDIQWNLDAEHVSVLHVLGVHPKFQGKGLAIEIVKEAIELSKQEGMEIVRLDALASNKPAHKVYESLGFVYCGKKEMYADNTGWTDFYFFEKEIKNIG